MYRGNLHTHTTVSDGMRTPQQAIAWYHEQGYDFLAITDHWQPYQGGPAEQLLVIPGMEFDGNDPELGPFHIVGLSVGAQPVGGLHTAADVTDHIRQSGGLALLCHPYWCGMPSWAAMRVPGVFGVEVFNATCEALIAKGLSSVHWDDALAGGRRLWGLAVDDTHWRWPDSGRGWVMVQAEGLTTQAVLDALVDGRFYATQGPEIIDFSVDGGIAYARTSAAKRIAFVCDGPHGRCFWPAAGERGITSAEWPVAEKPSYVRLEVDDADGRRAWSNPIFLRE